VLLILENDEVDIMKSFVVGFHQEDNVDAMQIQKINQEEFGTATEGGTRHLFELDTNIGLFVFFDAADIDGNLSYMVLQYEGENEDPVACYSFQLKDFYEFMALYLNDMDYEINEEEDYGPIHHLAHLLFHIVEEGKDLEV
jgi:hypothetical protein